jgi:tetratricopeptide (TPR) repeat protein
LGTGVELFLPVPCQSIWQILAALMCKPLTKDLTIIGANIRRLRRKYGLTLEDISFTEYPQAYVRDLENGRAFYSELFLRLVAIQLGVSFEELHKPLAASKPRTPRRATNPRLTEAHEALNRNQTKDCYEILANIDYEKLSNYQQATFLHLRGEVYFKQGDYKNAHRDLKNALEKLQNIPTSDRFTMEQVRFALGKALYMQGRYLEALDYHEKCLQSVNAGKIIDQHFIMKIFYQLANDHFHLSNMLIAEEFGLLAVKIAEEIGEKLDLAGVCWTLGAVYRHIKDKAKTKEFLFRSALLYQELKLWHYASAVKGQIGQALIEAEEYTQAESALITAAELAELAGDDFSRAVVKINMAYLYYTIQNLEKARQAAEEGVKYARQINNNMVLGQGLAQLAEIVLAQGLQEEGMAYFNEAIQALEKTSSYEHTSRVYHRYYKALKKADNITEAIQKCKSAYEYLLKARK